MMPLTLQTHFKFNLPNLPNQISQTHVEVITVNRPSTATTRPQASFFLTTHCNSLIKIKPKLCSNHKFVRRVFNDGGGAVDATPQQSPTSDIEAASSGDGYVALFVRMLGLDNDPLDREQAIVALWKYSLGGKQYVDAIMRFPGSINLTVNLLKSESISACEAAASLLRMMSLVNSYRELVAESGAIEEITGLLQRYSLASVVKEQCLCTLWNLSVDEKLRPKIANEDLLPLLIKCLEEEDIKVVEAAGGVLANLALSHSNHKTMVEEGVIPRLAELLKADVEGSKVIRKEAKNILLEIAKDDYYRILVIEEGLVLVPLIGSAAYKSFRPALHSWPSLPDGTEIEQSPKRPSSRFGASELLIGLNVQDENSDLEEAKMKAIVGRTQQQFLARIGAIELEDQNTSKGESESSSDQRITILPWMDGIARLVLILELNNESAIARAAKAIADASISEHMRVSFKEAGAVKHLVQLMDHQSDTVRLAALHALERLSLSNDVCQRIEEEGILRPLIDSLKKEISGSGTDMILNILARILDPSKEMKSKFCDGPVNGIKRGWNGKSNVEDVNELAVSRSTSSLQTIHAGNLVDPAFLACLIEILKTSFPVLQRKAASVLEYVAVDESCMDKITSLDIESGLNAVFRQNSLDETESDIDYQQPELHTLEVEEAGLAISAASRLLTRLLDSEKFHQTLKSSHFTNLLRKILVSPIPLHNKDWVAACLVKLSSLLGPTLGFENPINEEVTLYETIPRLIQEIKTSFSPEIKEIAVVELNRIISEGVVDFSRAVAAEGGIFPLVKLIEEGNDRTVDAGLAILYNLSMDNENHSAILAAGAVPILRRIVLSQRPRWTRALHLLRTLPI